MSRKRLIVVGGPDVDARIPLLKKLSDSYEPIAFGTDKTLKDTFDSHEIEFHHYPLTRGFLSLKDLSAQRICKDKFTALKPDIVHTFDTKPSVFARLAADQAQVPTIIGTLPGLGILWSGNQFSLRWRRSFYSGLHTKACKVSSCTVFQNQDDIDLMVRERVVEESKARLIRGSGIEAESYNLRWNEEEKSALREELGLSENDFVITNLGRWTRSKGILQLIEALPYLSKTIPQAKLLLIGKEDTNGLDRLTPKEVQKIKAHALCPGYVSDPKKLLALSDVFVFPSTYREGLPRVLMEAALLKIPIVAADNVGTREIVQQETTGLLLPPNNPQALAVGIIHIFQNEKLSRKLTTNAHNLVLKEFTLDKIQMEHRRLYDEFTA